MVCIRTVQLPVHFPSNYCDTTELLGEYNFVVDTSTTYTYKLTSVTDNAGNTRNAGTLQTS